MYKSVFKRILDIIISLMILPIFLILLLIIGLLIYLEDKGPIFYKAPRLGKNGKVFNMFKFRSMKVNAPDIRNADGSTFNSEDDPRVTKIGKLLRKSSIDEIPQILNVLRGDMSIIGPRPPLPEAYEIYSEDEKKKLEVKPGITGYNQAYYRNSLSQFRRIENDIYYVNNVSFQLDFKIFLSTINTVLTRKNIYFKS